MLKEVLGMSERLACKAVGLARSTYRRIPLAQSPADPDAQLRGWLRAYSTTEIGINHNLALKPSGPTFGDLSAGLAGRL